VKIKKKQIKITHVQLSVAEKKMKVLGLRQAKLTKQITLLKTIVRKYIQQNMVVIDAYCGTHSQVGLLRWAVAKVKCGYFGVDVSLGNLVSIIEALEKAKL